MTKLVLLSILLLSRIVLADDVIIQAAKPKDAGMSEAMLVSG